MEQLKFKRSTYGEDKTKKGYVDGMRSSVISYLGWKEKNDAMFIRVPLE